jgi:hypothetical protein
MSNMKRHKQTYGKAGSAQAFRRGNGAEFPRRNADSQYNRKEVKKISK